VSGLVQTLRQIGGTLGVAVVGSMILFAHEQGIALRIDARVPAAQRESARELLRQASRGDRAAIRRLADDPPLQQLEREAFSHSVSLGWWTSTAALTVALVAATRLRSAPHAHATRDASTR
jgi:hypothetical protein